VEFVRKQRTNYARSRVQPFQTRTQPRGSRLRACQKDFFDKLTSAFRSFGRRLQHPVDAGKKPCFLGGMLIK